jgi:hypothetical protein
MTAADSLTSEMNRQGWSQDQIAAAKSSGLWALRERLTNSSEGATIAITPSATIEGS